MIAEPSDGSIICAQAGALTFRARITGTAAHACDRLDGVSALDRFLPVYAALHRLEAEMNAGVAHPLMARKPLPYPFNVGRLTAGDWPSTVPDELVFEGRVGVPVGSSADDVRRQVERAIVDAADDRGTPPEISWSGGQFEPSETRIDHPLVRTLSEHIAAVTGSVPPLDGASYGSDMRLYRAAGIPTVMYGPGEIHQAHATDESIDIDALVRHVQVMRSLAAQFGRS